MVLNTTRGPVEYDRSRPGHVVNTSRVVDEDMRALDEEAEIVHVLSAMGYAATFEDGRREDLVFWVVDDEGAVFGATLNAEGRADLASVEDRPGFVGYEKINDEEK